jgi:cytochrome P450
MPRTTTPPAASQPAATKRLPFAPSGDLLFGYARDFQRDLLGTSLGLAARGDAVRFRFLVWPTVFLNHPDYIKHVLQENYRNYDKREISNLVVRAVFGNGLFSNDGPSWLQQRRLMQPAFHHQRIAAFGALMTGEAEALMRRWDARPAEAPPLNVMNEMMRVTLRVVNLALFGGDMDEEVERVGRAFSVVLQYLMRASFEPYVLLPGVPARGKREFLVARADLDRTVYGIIARRRAEGREGAERGDLLSLLLNARDAESGAAMSDRQAHDEVMTLLAAGHETTAVALTWVWYLLSRNPEAEARLHTELSAVLGGRPPAMEDLARLPYTRMVIEETLRLYPPATVLIRRAIGADQFGPDSIPAGTLIQLTPYAIHRHPSFWEHPEVFDPERFTPERSAGRPRFAYIPFGGGPRQCIGNTFALAEAQLVLATIAQRYRLRQDPPREVKAKPVITLRPDGGMPMRLERRG